MVCTLLAERSAEVPGQRHRYVNTPLGACPLHLLASSYGGARSSQPSLIRITARARLLGDGQDDRIERA
jgi:hypothetical protein